MNAGHRIILLVRLVTGAILLMLATRAVALPFAHADVAMSNIHWTPATGTLVWTTDWELTATALAFDTVTGHIGESFFDFGPALPVTLAAHATGGFSSAAAEVAVDATGEVLSLTTSMDLTFPPGDPFVSAFPAASAYREFLLTGGTDAVDVTFSFDYLGHLRGDDPGHGVDFRALLSVAGATDLAVYRAGSGVFDEIVAGTATRTVSLQFNTPYSLVLSVDGNVSVPDGGPGTVLAGVIFLCPFVFRRLRPAIRKSEPQ